MTDLSALQPRTAPSPNGSAEMEFEVVLVTPELAAQMLSRNSHNRNLRESVVARFATDMLEGNWTWNAQPIMFSRDGVLLDGQHRLSAIVRSGVAMSLLVVRGLDATAQETIDVGLRRSFNDVLTLRGETNANMLAAIVRMVAVWDSGSREFDGGSASTFSTQVLLATLERHPELREVATRVRPWRDRIPAQPAIVGLLYWVLSNLDDDSAEDAEEFFERLASDVGHREREPVYEVRRKLIETKGRPGNGRLLSRTFTAAIVIKGWNTYRQGREVSFFKFKKGGANPEAFPVPE